MSAIKQIPKVKLIEAVMFKDWKIYNSAIKEIKKRFGEIDAESEEYDFNFTNYYDGEMGSGYKKKIISFEKLINRGKLADIKLFTNEIEKKFSEDGKRRINIDPGYLTLHNLVLASAKELPHRIFIGKGIFAESTLTFVNNKWVPSQFTFPEFKSEEKIHKFLLNLRKTLKYTL